MIGKIQEFPRSENADLEEQPTDIDHFLVDPALTVCIE
jgi:hypothetical protein